MSLLLSVLKLFYSFSILSMFRSILKNPLEPNQLMLAQSLMMHPTHSFAKHMRYTHSHSASFRYTSFSQLSAKVRFAGDKDKDKEKSQGDHFRRQVHYLPKSENQQKYNDMLDDFRVRLVVCHGPAGTGKTLFACNQAVKDLEKGIIRKIVITRPVVSVDEELGFLPGTISNKMDPWTRPLFDILSEFYSKRDIEKMVLNGTIEISPLAFMRGRTFKKAFIIADEMQNSSPNQMMMLTTRIGGGSKMVITGDLLQSDRCQHNGLSDLIQRLKYCKPEGIECVELGNSDVFRSAVASRVVHLYEKSLDELKRQCAPPKWNTEVEVDADTQVLHEIEAINQLFTELEQNTELRVSALEEEEILQPLPLPLHEKQSCKIDSYTPSTSTDELLLMELEKNSELEVSAQEEDTVSTEYQPLPDIHSETSSNTEDMTMCEGDMVIIHKKNEIHLKKENKKKSKNQKKCH
jgi:phosphate starvation-inducible PhoH-like protein